MDDTSTEFAPLAQRSTEIIEQIRDRDWDRVTVDWDETMPSKLPVEQLGEVWQVRLVMARTAPAAVTTAQGSPAWLWVGVDERGRELEVVAVQAQSDRDPEPVLLVIQVMPTQTGVGWAGAE